MLLPGASGDGWTLLHVIRESQEWALLPVIIVTGVGIASREWAEDLGAEAVIHKPIHTEELLSTINQYVIQVPSTAQLAR
jgi:CheY-like chemotaxis protein